jgi:hypothetical protein
LNYGFRFRCDYWLGIVDFLHVALQFGLEHDSVALGAAGVQSGALNFVHAEF